MLIKPGPDCHQPPCAHGPGRSAPWGDLTSRALIPASAHVTARLVAREPGVLSGEDAFIAAMSLTDPVIGTQFHVQRRGTVLRRHGARCREGPAQPSFQAERVALNFVQRMSGIATLTAQYVSAVAGTRARIVDTRKTTPGLRLIERYAVRCGGGHNHRFSLSDAVMVKDNHLAILAASGISNLTEALQSMRASLPHTTHVEVEVDHPDQIEAVLAGGAETILLDNFTTAQLYSAVAQIAGRALVEAGGGITLGRIPEIAASGVDIISVGALTHSVRSLDLGLDIFSE